MSPDLLMNWWYGDNVWTKQRTFWKGSVQQHQHQQHLHQSKDKVKKWLINRQLVNKLLLRLLQLNRLLKPSLTNQAMILQLTANFKTSKQSKINATRVF